MRKDGASVLLVEELRRRFIHQIAASELAFVVFHIWKSRGCAFMGSSRLTRRLLFRERPTGQEDFNSAALVLKYFEKKDPAAPFRTIGYLFNATRLKTTLSLSRVRAQ